MNGPIRPTGYTAQVDADTHEVLLARGVIATGEEKAVRPAPVVEESAPQPGPSAPAVKTVGKNYPPLPKKSQGINVWREYARDNDIDVRGLSEKAELIGHITKVVNNQ